MKIWIDNLEINKKSIFKVLKKLQSIILKIRVSVNR